MTQHSPSTRSKSVTVLSLTAVKQEYRLESMSTLEELLGIDPEDPAVKRQVHLSKEDLALRQKLFRLRVELGFTQAQVAKLMGVTQSTVSTFERMENDPKLSTVRRYAGAIGVLIRHHVEVDSGQLLDGREVTWTASYSPASAASARTPIKQGIEGEASEVARSTSGSTSYAASPSTSSGSTVRTSVALAA